MYSLPSTRARDLHPRCLHVHAPDYTLLVRSDQALTMHFTYTASRFPVQQSRVSQLARFIPLSALLEAICTSLGIHST